MPVINPARQRAWLSPRYGRLTQGFEWIFWIFTMVYGTGAIFVLAIQGKQSAISLAVPEGDLAAFHSPLMQIIWVLIYAIFLVFAIWRLPRVYQIFKRNPGILIVLPLVILISVLGAQQIDISFRRAVGPIMLTFMGAYLAIRYSLRDNLRLLAATYAVIILSSAFVMAFMGGLGVMVLENPGTWTGSFVHKNLLGHATLIGILIFTYMATTSHHLVKAYWVGLIAISLVLMAGAHSTTAVVIGLLLIPLSMLLRSMKRRSDDFAIIVMTVILVIAIFVPLLNVFWGQILALFGKDTTLTGRTRIWELGIEAIFHRPIFGYGFGNYWENLGPFGGSSLRAQVGWRAPHLHNGWLELAAEIGIVGVVAYGRLIFGALQQALAAARKTVSGDYFVVILFVFYMLIASISEAALLQNNSQQLWLTAFYFTCQLQLLNLRKDPVPHPEMVGTARLRRGVRQPRRAG